MQPDRILETILYAADLGAAETFYRDVLGLEPRSRAAGRQLFYRIGPQMLLIFNPAATAVPPPPNATLPVPPHGAQGPGHVCFAATAAEIDQWVARLGSAWRRHRGRLPMADAGRQARWPLDLFP